jgi:hypothetical protein
VLLAPWAFRGRYAATAQKFGSFVAHEETARYVSSFRIDHDDQDGSVVKTD